MHGSPTTTRSEAPQGHRRGRPPKAGAGKDSTRDRIIAAASALFYEQGFAHTSLSEIARHVDMDPSSLYYYFPSKIALLESIFDPRDLAPSLEVLSQCTPSHTEQLYALIVHDVVCKCRLPFDFIEMESIAHEEPRELSAFFESYRRFYCSLVEVIEKGIAKGEFKPGKADERAVTILSVNEGLQHHYHAKNRGQLILEVSGYTARDYSPEDIGNLSALSIMPALMADPALFESAVEGGKRVYQQMVELKRNRATQDKTGSCSDLN